MNAADDIYRDLFAPIEKRMMRTVYRIIQDPDDAADAFQNALTKIWNRLDCIIRHPNPQAYVLSICISSSYDYLRERARRSRHMQPLEENAVELSKSYEMPKYPAEIIRAIQRGIAALPLKQAQAVLLRIFEEESFGMIGEVLGCSEATARSHVSKGLARLRELLADWDISTV